MHLIITYIISVIVILTFFLYLTLLSNDPLYKDTKFTLDYLKACLVDIEESLKNEEDIHTINRQSLLIKDGQVRIQELRQELRSLKNPVRVFKSLGSN